MQITIANRGNTVYKVSGRMSLLQELREQGVDLPYGCQYGGCITCAAKLIKGEIDQRSQVALNNRQINNGYIILCVARPKTDCTIEIGVESHDKLYRNPFLDPLAPHELKADIATQKILQDDIVLKNITIINSSNPYQNIKNINIFTTLIANKVIYDLSFYSTFTNSDINTIHFNASNNLVNNLSHPNFFYISRKNFCWCL